VGGWVEFGFEAWVSREVFVGRWGVGTGIGIFVDELLRDAKRMGGGGWRGKRRPNVSATAIAFTVDSKPPGKVREQRGIRETHAMFESIQIVHLAQLGPKVLHGHLIPCITVYRIVHGQDVRVTMNADGPGAHYRTEERDLGFWAVEEIF
jgi:hypothetical protein